MRLFLDENESPALLPPLQTLYARQHEFRSAIDEQLLGTDDLALFTELRSRRFDAIITRDRAQLSYEELDALLENNLHWIGHREPPLSGVAAIAMLGAAYFAALPTCCPYWSERPSQCVAR